MLIGFLFNFLSRIARGQDSPGSESRLQVLEYSIPLKKNEMMDLAAVSYIVKVRYL